MDNHRKKATTQALKCTSCFKSVSIPSRMAIYNYLNKFNKASVGELVEQVGLKQPTVSYHLKEMKHSGLLRSDKSGKEVFYSINHMCPHFAQACVLHGLEFPDA